MINKIYNHTIFSLQKAEKLNATCLPVAEAKLVCGSQYCGTCAHCLTFNDMLEDEETGELVSSPYTGSLCYRYGK